jgi:hypothetical protein
LYFNILSASFTFLWIGMGRPGPDLGCSAIRWWWIGIEISLTKHVAFLLQSIMSDLLHGPVYCNVFIQLFN